MAYLRARSITLLLLACAISVASGCGDTVAPGAELVAGSYTADIFEYLRSDGTAVSLLSSGSSAEVRLAPDGTFSSSLTVPAALAHQESPILVTGRWSFSEGALTLSGTPDTFLNQTAFAVRDGGLMYGQALVDDVSVRIRLARDRG